VGEPVGGTDQLFRRLQFHVESNGTVNLGEKALEILVENGHVTGVRTERELYPCRRVVFAAPLGRLFGIADPSLFDKAFVDYCTGIEHSSSLCFDFITNGPVTDIKGGILGIDIPVWARFQTNADPSFTPQGKYLSTWGIMLPWGFDGDPDVVKATEKRLKLTLSRVFPHLLPTLLKERRLVIGEMNGTVLIPRQSRPHRPGVACTTVQGLFFAGDTVQGEGCSGDISFSSAMKVADSILEQRHEAHA
jgi:phytoene dehydrogenase-like protein